MFACVHEATVSMCARKCVITVPSFLFPIMRFSAFITVTQSVQVSDSLLHRLVVASMQVPRGLDNTFENSNITTKQHYDVNNGCKQSDTNKIVTDYYI